MLRRGVRTRPRILDGLLELPGGKARAEAAADRLGLLGALVVAETQVGETEGLGKHPAIAVVAARRLHRVAGDASRLVAAGVKRVFARWCYTSSTSSAWSRKLLSDPTSTFLKCTVRPALLSCHS